MKKLVFLTAVFVALFIFNAQAQVIGKLVKGEPAITVNKSELISIYNENLLKLSGIDGKFTEVKLISNQKGQYLLVFKGSKYKSTLAGTEDGGVIALGGGISCTTIDCSMDTGCVPWSNGLKCSPCGGDCRKTVSSRSMIVRTDKQSKN